MLWLALPPIAVLLLAGPSTDGRTRRADRTGPVAGIIPARRKATQPKRTGHTPPADPPKTAETGHAYDNTEIDRLLV